MARSTNITWSRDVDEIFGTHNRKRRYAHGREHPDPPPAQRRPGDQDHPRSAASHRSRGPPVALAQQSLGPTGRTLLADRPRREPAETSIASQRTAHEHATLRNRRPSKR